MNAPYGGRPVKRSLTLNGHRTSVSLEDVFWEAFREIAARRRLGINALASEIDAQRGDIGLASAIRVFVVQDLVSRKVPCEDPDAPHVN